MIRWSMKKPIPCLILFLIAFVSCNDRKEKTEAMPATTPDKTDSIAFLTGYSDVNGIKIYYETCGKGEPLVLIPGGGSTIESSFGRIIPLLEPYYQVISLDLQNH